MNLINYLIIILLCVVVSCSGDDNEDEMDVVECGPFPDQESSSYILPFEVGETYSVGQGSCSPAGRSHALGTVEQYAYDILMPIGTPIVASNTGTVTRVEEGFAENNGTPGQENRIEIMHGDGSTSVYIHLTTDGADVSVGEKVFRGEIIGRSGNTGNSTEPHLHFCRWRGTTSIPTVFKNTKPHPNGLIEGDRYESLPF